MDAIFFCLTECTVPSEITRLSLKLLKLKVITFGAMDTPRIALGGISSIAVTVDPLPN
jgi:hypothetical protein